MNVGHARQQGRTRQSEDGIVLWEISKGLWVKEELLLQIIPDCNHQAQLSFEDFVIFSSQPT